MDLGIVGLEHSGKTTVFNALSRGHARTGTFGASEPNIGVVKIPDERLERLAALIRSRKTTYAEVRYLDFPGGFSVRGEGPPPSYLAALSQCDALVHVVRAFRDESVPHPQGPVDPARDIAAVDLELAFADIALLERRYERLETAVRSARAGEREPGERELALVTRLRESLEREEPIRRLDLSPEDKRLLSGFQLLTTRPLLIVLNIDEADVKRADEIETEFSERFGGAGLRIAALSGKLEQELSELPDAEVAEFQRELGVQQRGLERMLRLSHDVRGLITFFTVGEQEARAWPLTAGLTAVEAAGKVHTDMARGFIRAEVIGTNDLIASGSYAEARKRGLLRTEGKQYVVQDGDVLHILFNV
jgi:hypothetical protein